MGVGALQYNETGSFNSAVGRGALTNNKGSNNTAVGYNAGSVVTTGTGNVCIGQNANVNAGARSNCIVLGSGATAILDGEIAFASTLSTKTTIGANGAATALTALPVGYIRIRIGATPYQIPFYNV